MKTPWLVVILLIAATLAAFGQTLNIIEPVVDAHKPAIQKASSEARMALQKGQVVYEKFRKTLDEAAKAAKPTSSTLRTRIYAGEAQLYLNESDVAGHMVSLMEELKLLTSDLAAATKKAGLKDDDATLKPQFAKIADWLSEQLKGLPDRDLPQPWNDAMAEAKKYTNQ